MLNFSIISHEWCLSSSFICGVRYFYNISHEVYDLALHDVLFLELDPSFSVSLYNSLQYFSSVMTVAFHLLFLELGPSLSQSVQCMNSISHLIYDVFYYHLFLKLGLSLSMFMQYFYSISQVDNVVYLHHLFLVLGTSTVFLIRSMMLFIICYFWR